MWKDRCGFSNGLGSPDSLLAEWKEIRKKSQIVARKVAVIMNKGHWPILEKVMLFNMRCYKNEESNNHNSCY
jgi:hypothetical protein